MKKQLGNGKSRIKPYQKQTEVAQIWILIQK